MKALVYKGIGKGLGDIKLFIINNLKDKIKIDK